MLRGIIRAISERLWFGRQYAVGIQVLLALIPIVLAFLAQDTPRFFATYSSVQLLILIAISGVICIPFNFVTLSVGGANTYSPSLHSPKFIIQSTIVQILLAGIVVYLGYLLLVYPVTERLVPVLNEVLVGVILTAILSILFAMVTGWVSYSRDGGAGKEDHIDEFLSECDKMSTSATDAIRADEDKIDNAISNMLDGLEDEPMSDAGSFKKDLEDWHEEFRMYNTGGKRKMVGGIPDTKAELEEPWDSLHNQFQSIEKTLRAIEKTALNSTRRWLGEQL